MTAMGRCGRAWYNELVTSKTPPDLEGACRHLRAASRRQGGTTVAAYTTYRAAHTSAPSPSAVVGGFGSWSVAISAAGLQPSSHRGRPAGAVLFGDELVAGLLRQCAEQIGHPPGVRDYERWRAEMVALLRIRIPGSAILRRRYGGWGGALRAAGISPRS